MADAIFRAGGLASGIDTNSMIDQLVKLEAAPMELLRKRQAGLQARVTGIGDLMAKLADLNSAFKSLGDSGALGTRITSTNTGFTAVSGASAIAGTYDVSVGGLARAAQMRSQAFSSPSAPVRATVLDIQVMGTSYQVEIPDGTTLADVALRIGQSGAPVNAVVLSNGTTAQLSITNRNSGHPLDGQPEDALVITEPTDFGGDPAHQRLLATTVQAAANSSVTVNGMVFTRQSNTVADVIPGVTLTLKGLTAGDEVLSIDNDVEGTTKNLTKLVDSYNNVMRAIQKHLQVAPGADRSGSLAGDSALRSLQMSLQGLITTVVGQSNVRTLADVGIKTARDGTISLDGTVLARAMSNDAAAVNDLFSRASSGLAAVARGVIDRATNSTDGTLISRRKGLSQNIKSIDQQLERLQYRLDAFRAGLIAQFTAMEKVVSGMKSIGNFLNQQSLAAAGGNQ